MSERKTAYDWASMCRDQNIEVIMPVIQQAMDQARKEALEEAAKLVRIHGTFGFFTRTDEIMKLLDKKSIDDLK